MVGLGFHWGVVACIEMEREVRRHTEKEQYQRKRRNKETRNETKMLQNNKIYVNKTEKSTYVKDLQETAEENSREVEIVPKEMKI